MAESITLNLNALFAGRPGLTPSEGGHLAECATVCYDNCGHATLPDLTVIGKHDRSFMLAGPAMTNRMRRTYADLQEATEYGSCAIAVLLMEVLTVFERASKGGGGFDYYLTPVNTEQARDTDNFLGTATAALEVSGIMDGTVVVLQHRINEKRRQLHAKHQLLPVYIVVVGFKASTAGIDTL